MLGEERIVGITGITGRPVYNLISIQTPIDYTRDPDEHVSTGKVRAGLIMRLHAIIVFNGGIIPLWPFKNSRTFAAIAFFFKHVSVTYMDAFRVL